MTPDDRIPFSCPMKVRSLPVKGQLIEFEADDEVCQKIAVENDLIAVTSFFATAHLSPWKRDGVSVSGKVAATLVQPCAVTGEPLAISMEEPVQTTFVPDDSKLAKPRRKDENERILDPEGDDVPDTFTRDTIDLAGPWLETFVLGLDPFARKEDAELPVTTTDGESGSPLAALARLKLL